MSASRTRLLWLFLPLALVLVVSAPSAKKTETRSGTLRFEMLDGSSEDLDGVADGIWTVPGGMILEGNLVCGEAGGNEAVASQCAMALRVEGDLDLRSGGAIAAADGLELDIDGDLRIGSGSVIASEHGAVEIAARGRIDVDGLLSSGGDASSKSRAHREPSTSIRLRSTGGPGSGIRLGASGTVLSTGAARAGGLIELSGCGLEIHGLIASIGEGPGAGIVLRSCEGLMVDGRDLADPAGLHRGRLEVRGSGAARIDLFAQDSVVLDGAELGVAGGTGGDISVTADRGSLSWERGKGAAGPAGAIRLRACDDVDLDGSRLAPTPEIVEACAGVEKVTPDPGLVPLPPEFSGSGLVEAPGPQASGGTCTPNLAVDNMTISTFAEFISCNVLTSSNTRIIPRGRVTFKALTAIELGNGFSVEGSSHFTAVIDPTLNQPPSITSDGGGATASKSIPENTTAVTDVDATDPEGETESGGGLTYSLSGADGAKFSIDAAGMLAFVTAPDFDNPGDADSDNDYEVTVTVTDTVLLTDTQDITVTVTDVNEAPVITSNGGSATASVSVDENTTAVTTVTATDEDVPAQTLTYSITGGADMAKFSIVGTTGVLTFAAAPDFEIPGDMSMDNDYEVQVTVTDDGTPNLSDVQDITVSVDDANDAPMITSDGGGTTASKSIAENTTAVTDVDAADPEGETESGGGLTYSLSGDDGAKFSVDAAGMLAFVAAPDFDVAGDANADNDYEVTVTVTDTGLLTDTQDITVTVTDVNETPVITSDGGGATASVSVDENQTAVTTVTATDEDVPAQTLTYSITGGTDMAKFSIVGATGVLTFAVAPDFENPGDANMDNDYEVEVTVTDDGTPNLSDVQDITVSVDDANDAPMITSDGGGATAAVSVDENTTAVTTVVATDVDMPAQTLTFSISGGADMAKFSIVAATGVLTFAAAPDFDIPGDANMDNDYEVEVTVTDNGAPNLSDIQDITVTVDDVNEAPVITSDGGGATASVSVDENQTAVTTVTATDEDVPAQTLTYSITGGTDMTKFSIVGATGVLTFAAAPDFENPGDANMDNDYEVEVTVTDDGTPNLSDVQALTVTVDDANDAPVITSDGGGATASVSVDENTTAVTTVTATDEDVPAQTLTYSITGGADMAEFSIVGATGVLTFAAAPDFDIPGDANMDNDYEVEVTVTDDGAPNLSDIQDITVTVDDVNEAPEITSDGGGATASVSVDENQTAVTTVTATDEDVPAQTLTYSITGGTDMTKFSIVGATGVLTFAAAPNFEIPGDANMDNDYEVEVTATDNGTPNLSDVQALTVTVDNVDEAPMGGADGFDYVGNTLLLVDKTTSGSPEIIATTTSTNGVLDNDFDPEMAAISVSGVFASMTPCPDMTAPFTDCPTANGGKVTMESSGEFSYTPKAGDTAATDMFGYKVSDGVNEADVVVTLTRKNRVWYVKNNNMSGTDDGTSGNPFDTLTEAGSASVAGDTIFVSEGAGTTAGQNAGITLKPMQRLLGEGVALTVPDTVNGVVAPTLFAAGNKPAVEHAIAMMDGITVDATTADRTGIEIRGLAISGTRNAIDVTSADTFAVGIIITDNLFDDSGEEAIDLNPGGSGDFVAVIDDNTFSTSSPTGNAIDVVTTAGAGDVEVSINNNTDITSSGGAGINIDGTLGTGTLFVTGFADNTVHGATGGTGINVLDATFDADTGTAGFQEVDAGTTAVGSGGDPVGGSGMILGSPAGPVSGNLSFGQFDAFGGSGTGLAAHGTGAATGGSPPTAGFALGIATGTVSEASGKGLELDSLTAGITLASLSSTSSSNDSNGQGVDIANVVGTVTMSAGTIMHTGTATAFDVGDTGDMSGGNANITYAGSITNTNGRAVLIQQRSGGTITLSGTINESGDGIRLANNTDGDNTITFSGANSVISTGGSDAIRLDNNESAGNEATINFTGGGLDIDVSTGFGLHATGGGILNVTGSGNTITVTGAGQAVVMNGMDLGANDVTFDSITSTGTGGTAPFADVLSFANVNNAGTFEGGTVSIADTAATGDGIDIGGGSANYHFTSFTVANAGGSGINIDAATGDITFDTIDIDAPGGYGVRINAYAGAAADNFTISGGTIDDPTLAGVSIVSATSQVNIGSLTIDDTGAEGVAISGSSGTINVTSTTIGEVGVSANTTAGNALDIDGGAGTVTVNGSIVNTAGKSVEITNRTGGSVNIGSSIDDDGTGISLNNTAGTFNFSGGMDLDTGAITAFNAIGGGTVNVTGTNTIGAAGAISGIGVDIDNVDIGANGLTFASLAVDGASHGIRIKNAAGNATFTTVAIANTVQSSAQTFSPFSAMNTRETPNENGDGDGIYLQDNTGTFAVNGGTITSSGDNAIDVFDAGGITISDVTIDGSANTAIQATRVAGLSIIDTMVKNFGNATAVSTARENAVTLREVTGAIKLQRSTIDTGFDFVFERFAQLPENIGLELNNISAAPAILTVTGATIKKLDFQGMQIRYQDSDVTVRLDGSTMDGPNALSFINGAAIDFGQTAADNGSTGTLVVNDSTFTDVGIGTRVGNLSNTGGAPASVTNVRLEDNTITRTFAEGFRLRGFGGPNRSTFNMRVIDNDIFDVGRAISTVGGAGQTGAGNGIESLLEDRIDAKVLIDGNTIDDVTPDAGSLGVNIRTTDGTDLDLVFTNNMVLDVGNSSQGTTGSPTGIVEIGAFANAMEPNPDTCVHFTGNTLTPRLTTPKIFSNLFLDDTTPAAKFILQGLITGGDSLAASTFLDMSNTWPPAQFPGITVGVANLLDAHVSETCSLPPAIP